MMTSPYRYVSTPPNNNLSTDRPVMDHGPSGVPVAQSAQPSPQRPPLHFVCRPDCRLDDDSDFITDESAPTPQELAKAGVNAIDFAYRPDNPKPERVCRCPAMQKRRMEYNIVLKHHGREPMQIHVPHVRVGASKVPYTGPISWPNSPAPTRPTSPAQAASPSNLAAEQAVLANPLSRPPLLSEVIAALAEASRVERERALAAFSQASAASQQRPSVALGGDTPPAPLPSSSIPSEASTLKRKRSEASLANGSDTPGEDNDSYRKLSVEGMEEELTQPWKRARKCEVVATTTSRVTRSQTAEAKAATQPIAARLRTRPAKPADAVPSKAPRKTVVAVTTAPTKLRPTDSKLRARISNAVALSTHSKTSKIVASKRSKSNPNSKAKVATSGKRGRK